MGSQLIEYAYDGDEEVWRETIETFLGQVDDDPVLREGFSYHVYLRPDGISRVHVPVWRDEAVLEHLRAQPFFKTFSEKINELAGDSLQVTKRQFGS